GARPRRRFRQGLQRVREHRPPGGRAAAELAVARDARCQALAAFRGPGDLQPRGREVPARVRQMLSAEQIADAAARLDEAERTLTPIRQLSLQYPQMTIEDAYAVQRAWVAEKLARG